MLASIRIASYVDIACAIHRSNPSTPTQPRRPDFIGVVYPNQTGQGQYYEFQHADNPPPRPMMPQGYGSPQRRFMSEGELVRQEAQLSYPRSNNTVDNIRELANSPQRGVYMWKDTSPGYPPPTQHHPDFYRSNPTSPTQQSYAVPPPRTYHPAMRGGVPVYPPPASPQVHRKPMLGANPPTITVDNRRRPMSFVRALEMTDSVEMTTQNSQCSAHNMTQRPSTPDRTSVYDMNYEISV